MNNKVRFDAYNDDHMLQFCNFMRSGRWGLCPFELEDGYDTIPGMILHKIAHKGMMDAVGKKIPADSRV